MARKPAQQKIDYTTHPLAHMIPEQKLFGGDEYVGRVIAGKKDVDILKSALEYRMNVLIEGPTGSAKTSFVYAFAADTGMAVVNVPCSQEIDVRSFIGGWQPRYGGGFQFVPGRLLLGAVHGNTIGYFDEVNALHGRVATLVHGALDKRRRFTVEDAAGSGWCANCGHQNSARLESIATWANELNAELKHTSQISADGRQVVNQRLVDHYAERYLKFPKRCENCDVDLQSTEVVCASTFMVVAAYNEGYNDMRQLNEAFKNRFQFQLHFDYSTQIEDTLLDSNALLELAGKLRKSFEVGDITTPISTNMLIEFEQFAGDPNLGLGFAIENFIARFTKGEQPLVQEVFKHAAGTIREELIAAMSNGGK